MQESRCTSPAGARTRWRTHWRSRARAATIVKKQGGTRMHSAGRILVACVAASLRRSCEPAQPRPPNYPDQAGQGHRSVRGRRPDRRDGAADRAETVGNLQAAILSSRTCPAPAAISAWARSRSPRPTATPFSWRVVELHGQSEPLRQECPYEPYKDFAPVTMAGAPRRISGRCIRTIPAKTFKELIDLIKANPGKYSVASPGIGTTPPLATEMFKLQLKLDATSRAVRRRGAGDAIGCSPVTRRSRFMALPPTATQWSRAASCGRWR